jgi:hypothetical protein
MRGSLLIRLAAIDLDRRTLSNPGWTIGAWFLVRRCHQDPCSGRALCLSSPVHRFFADSGFSDRFVEQRGFAAQPRL